MTPLLLLIDDIFRVCELEFIISSILEFPAPLLLVELISKGSVKIGKPNLSVFKEEFDDDDEAEIFDSNE